MKLIVASILKLLMQLIVELFLSPVTVDTDCLCDRSDSIMTVASVLKSSHG